MTVVSDNQSTRFRFVPAGESWVDQFRWARYDARIVNPSDGSIVFEQKDVEFPVGWDSNSINIVAQKYFWGDQRLGEREWSLKQLIDRVASRIVAWAGLTGVLRASGRSPEEYYNELAFAIADQRYSFNSPVWFNVGVEHEPQCSACFILSVEDDMDSIAENVKTEMLIFKGGSGAGSNRGRLRASVERVRGGGVASGPMSFIRVYDAGAGGIKSGGKTRRAAKMEILDVDHLDIEKFVTFKRDEERKAKILIEGGVDGSFCGEAYSTVSGQNANYSVRVDDAFMKAVREDGVYTLRGRKEKDLVRVIRARDLWRLMAQCAWECADPGIQFDGIIQDMHTCSNRDRIYASNPCSEYLFLDDTSCNLSSINLVKYLLADGTFDAVGFEYTVMLAAIAMDSFIDFASYPTEKIAHGTKTYRTLGIGYTGLGALFMHLGLPYDSVEARLIAGSITSLMSASAYMTSNLMATEVAPFADYEYNRDSFAGVMNRHLESARQLAADAYEPDVDFDQSVMSIAQPLSRRALAVWNQVVAAAEDGAGFRNAQVTVLAPTGTISFMMGCQASTGIEPVLGLRTFKNLAGGGVLTQVNPWVDTTLTRLGYDEEDRKVLIERLQETGSFHVAPPTKAGGADIFAGDGVFLKPEHAGVFMTAFPDPVSGASLHWRAHVDMMAACQPFISGAISKTINMPEESSVQDIEDAYMYAYEAGLKCVAIYRDNSKGVQAVSTKLKAKGDIAELLDEVRGPAHGERVRLPDTRMAVTTKFRIGQDSLSVKGYLTVGVDPEGNPKELFMSFDKAGGTVQGFMHAWCKAVSFGLQAGIPLDEVVGAFIHTRFDPSGPTRNPDIPSCTSIIDYVAKWLMLQFMPEKYQELAGPRPVKGISRLDFRPPFVPADPDAISPSPVVDKKESRGHTGTVCSCGAIMQRVGACEMCPNCSTSTGCGG